MLVTKLQLSETIDSVTVSFVFVFAHMSVYVICINTAFVSALFVAFASFDNVVPNIYNPNFYPLRTIHAYSTVALIVD